MAQTIKLKRSATPGTDGSAASLQLGEVAINTFDGRIFTARDNGTASIVEFLTDLDLVGTGTATTVSRSDHNHDTTYLGISAKAADSELLDGLDSTQFLRSDQDDVMTGKLTVNNLDFANPGAGNTSKINFLKSSDTASIEVTEVAADQTEFAFKMSDNPDSTSDKFYWHIDSYRGNHADWRPLLFSGLNATVTAVNTNYDSKVTIAENPFFNDGVTKNAYLKYLGTEGNITINVSGNTAGSRLEIILRVNVSLDVDVYVNQPLGNVLNQTATISTTVTPDGTAQAIGNGHTVVFPTTGLVEGQIWQYSSYPGGGIVTDTGLKYWNEGNDGIGSGLDADMLDGKHIGTSGNTVPVLDAANSWSASQQFNSSLFANAGIYSTDLTVNSQVLNTATDVIYFGNPNTSVVMESSAIGSVNISTFWRSGNDGAGSGLDADLLDAQQGSFYRDASNINAGTLAVVYGGTGTSTSTGTGSVVLNTSPTLVTPNIGVATGTSFNSITALSSTTPNPLGTAAVGTSTTVARADHVHAMPSLDSLSNVTITGNTTGEILKWDGAAWINNTLAEAGIQPAGTYNTIIGTDTDISYTGATVLSTMTMTDGVIQSHSSRTLTLTDLSGSIKELTDVFTTMVPTDGQVLTWDNANTRWDAIDPMVAVGIQHTFEFTAAQDQTTFTGSDNNLVTLSYTPGNIYVIVDGWFVPPSDYTASNGTSIVFAQGLNLNMEVSIVAFEPFALETAVLRTGDTMTGDLTVPNLTVTGTLTETSARKYKENIKPLEKSLEKVLKLQGVSYNKKGRTEVEIGLIADDVNEVIPEVINTVDNKIEGINYSRLVSVLIESVKELKVEVDSLKQEKKDDLALFKAELASIRKELKGLKATDE